MRSITALVGALAYRAGLSAVPPEDPIGEFLATLQPAPGQSVSGTDLWIAYRQWCLESAKAPVSLESFGRAMAGRLPMTRPRQARRFVGVKVGGQ